MTNIYDEKGNLIDFLAERNEKIKESLEGVLESFLKEKEMMAVMKREVKLGYRFTKQLYSVLASYPRLSPQEFVGLTYEDIENLWLKYLELTAYYNRFFEIVDNKQLFMAFCGINSRQYSELEKNEDTDIRELMNAINGAFIGLGFLANESGNANSSATMGRLQSRGEGHSLVKESEGRVVDAIEQRSTTELYKELEKITGTKFLK